jgi:hypothetical protein
MQEISASRNRPEIPLDGHPPAEGLAVGYSATEAGFLRFR